MVRFSQPYILNGSQHQKIKKLRYFLKIKLKHRQAYEVKEFCVNIYLHFLRKPQNFIPVERSSETLQVIINVSECHVYRGYNSVIEASFSDA